MPIVKVFTSLFLLLSALAVSAQKAPMKWGKVPPADLAMTEYDLDTEAEAVVLGEYATIDFSFDGEGTTYEFYKHKRVKILKKSGVDRGDISIYYYRKKGSEKIRNLKAQVIFPDGSKEEVGRKEIFDEKIDDFWSVKKFAFPNLKPGCIVEYKYTKTSDRIITLQDWYFQEDIPVRFSEIQLDIPSIYSYIYLLESGGGEIERFEKSNIQGGGGQTSFLENRVVFTMRNVEAMKTETYITTMKDYLSNVRFQLKQYTSNTGNVDVLSTWKKLAKTLEDDFDFGKQYLKSSYSSKIVKAAASHIDASASDLDKIKQAQKFIANQVKWDQSYSYWCSESLNKLFEKKIADSGEINMMLLALLKKNGIKAYPALTSTRNHGKVIQLYPIIKQFNHMVVYAEVDGKEMILDALDKYHPVGYPHSNALNHFAWVVDEKNPKWVDVQTKNSTKSLLATFELDATGSLKGTINAGSNGYYAIHERELFNDSKYGGWKEELETVYPETKIDSIEVINKEDINQSLKVHLGCTISNAATVSGDFIYINPVIVPAYDENPFKLEKRNYPIDQIHPWKENYILNLTIPEGYALEELPEPILLSLPDNGGRFSHQLKMVDETHIQLVSKVTIKQTYFRPEVYAGVKKFIDLIVEKQAEQIVLKKKS